MSADSTASVAIELVDKLRAIKFDKEVSGLVIKEQLADIIAQLLEKTSKNFELYDKKLNVILVCGVNGSGKTTTIGKLARIYRRQGKKYQLLLVIHLELLLLVNYLVGLIKVVQCLLLVKNQLSLLVLLILLCSLQ